MVISEMLVKIIGKAGVENCFCTHINKSLNVTVNKLCREANGITRNCLLTSLPINPNEVVQITGAESVPLGTLDRYEETHPMDVGLIKVDIEGAEQSFLRGARRTIEKYKPVLLMSIYHNADDFFNIKPMIESWNLGYKFRIHKPIDYSVSREVLLIAEVR